MATKLNGMIVLTKIPKELTRQTKNGEKCIFVDIVPNRNGADQYGNTHSVQLYNKETKQTIYLGNLKTVEFGQRGAAPSEPKEETGGDDLPW